MTVSKDRYTVIFKTTLVSASVNIFLSISKIIAGVFGNSHSLIADGLHSVSDLFTDLLVYFAAFFSSGKADQNHPYGHGKIEAIGTAFLAVLLLITSLGIIYDAAMIALSGQVTVPKLFVLIFVICSIVLNEFIYQYTAKKANEINSKLLMANAWHHRQDAASSAVVLFGVIGSLYGLFYFEAIAAAIIGLIIGKMSIQLFWQGIKELIDTAVDDRMYKKIHDIILDIDGVISIHKLRTRYIADHVFIDVHVQVSSMLTVSEGHYISCRIEQDLQKGINQSVDVLVHIDPEDDEYLDATYYDLKSRSKIIDDLFKVWDGLEKFTDIKEIRLHYLSGKVVVEVYFPYNQSDNSKILEERQQKYSKAAKEIDYIKAIVLLFGEKKMLDYI